MSKFLSLEHTTNGFKLTGLGLPNAYLESANIRQNDAGEYVVKITNLLVLMAAVSLAICGQSGRITPHEAKFLRKFLLLNQSELGKLLNKTRVTISRWESGAKPIDPNTELLLRVYVVEEIKSLECFEGVEVPTIGKLLETVTNVSDTELLYTVTMKGEYILPEVRTVKKSA